MQVTFSKLTFLALAGLVLLAGCATGERILRQPMTDGEAYLVDYTCRLPDDAVVLTTDSRYLDEWTDQTAGVRFVARKTYEAAVIAAGGPRRPSPDIIPLVDEVEFRIGQQLAGRQTGEIYHLELTSEAVKGLTDMERFIELARIMRRPKEQNMPREQFLRHAKKEPEPGEVLFAEGNVPWQVVSANEETVTIRYLADDGETIQMPFARGTVQDAGDHYDIALDIHTGDVVRIGPHLGRVAEMGERTFKADFAHPFGGQTLRCEIRARPVSAP